MTARRKSCKQSLGSVCIAAGKRGVCSLCTDMTAIRAARKKQWKDPEFRKRNAEATKANWKDPEFRKRHAEATKAAVAIQWDDDMDAALRNGLRRGHNMGTIAEHIGVCIATATKRAGELGLERARRGGTR